jgi:hypothetical protein
MSFVWVKLHMHIRCFFLYLFLPLLFFKNKQINLLWSYIVVSDVALVDLLWSYIVVSDVALVDLLWSYIVVSDIALVDLLWKFQYSVTKCWFYKLLLDVFCLGKIAYAYQMFFSLFVSASPFL